MKLVDFLTSIIKKNEKLNIILSGGNSPLQYYKSFSKKKINFKNLNFFLLDDRIVRNNSKYSNYNNIKKSFKKNKIIYDKILPLNKKNCRGKQLKKNIFLLKKYKVFSILGMGPDGHFASIFAASKKFREQINIKKKPSYFFSEKLGNPRVKRVSMNLSMILLSNYILLILNTKNKIKLFKKILKFKNTSSYSIFHLIKHAKKKILIYDGKKFLKIKDCTLQH
jgi:6-phosphogluconolactonase